VRVCKVCLRVCIKIEDKNMYVCAHSQESVFTHTNAHSYPHPYTHPYTHSYTHPTHTHNTHTHTHILGLGFFTFEEFLIYNIENFGFEEFHISCEIL
jgi:hypothetical protein